MQHLNSRSTASQKRNPSRPVLAGPANPCFNTAVRKASRVLTRIYDEEMSASGLTISQFGILVLLHAERRATVSDLAEWADVENTAMGRTLVPLERDGIISLSPGKDRRSKIVSLTAKGKARYKTASPLWAKAQKAVQDRMSEADSETMRRLLHIAAGS